MTSPKKDLRFCPSKYMMMLKEGKLQCLDPYKSGELVLIETKSNIYAEDFAMNIEVQRL